MRKHFQKQIMLLINTQFHSVSRKFKLCATTNDFPSYCFGTIARENGQKHDHKSNVR